MTTEERSLEEHHQAMVLETQLLKRDVRAMVQHLKRKADKLEGEAKSLRSELNILATLVDDAKD